MARRKKSPEELTEADQERAKEISKDIRTYADLEAVSKSHVLVIGLKKDILSALDTLSRLYKTAPEMELRAACAVFSERLTMLRALLRAPKQLKIAMEELDELMHIDTGEE